jgi:hypothetical protein
MTADEITALGAAVAAVLGAIARILRILAHQRR